MARVLLCSGLYPPHVLGGAERSVQLLAQGLVRRGHSVRVLTASPYVSWSSWWGSTEREAGIIVDRFFPANVYHLTEFRKYPAPVRLLWHSADVWSVHVWARTRWIIRTWRPDIVHVHHSVGLSMAPITAAVGANLPTVCTVHDHAFFCLLGMLRRPNGTACPSRCYRCIAFEAARKALTRPLSDVIAPSSYMLRAHTARGFFPESRLHVVPNGVAGLPQPAQKRWRPTDGSLRVAFVGQLVPYKGVMPLLEAFGTLLSGAVSLTFAGDGPLLDLCRAYAARDWRITVLGSIDARQRDALLASVDVLVLPSLVPESFGLVLAEAQIAGLPTIATRLGGMADIVDHEVNGLLVDPGDAGGLASALERLRADTALWDRCATGALESARRFDVGHWTDAIEAIYSRAIS